MKPPVLPGVGLDVANITNARELPEKSLQFLDFLFGDVLGRPPSRQPLEHLAQFENGNHFLPAEKAHEEPPARIGLHQFFFFEVL